MRRLAASLLIVGGLSAAPVSASAAAGPVVSVVAPASYFPVRDGYQDVFPVTIATNEQATAHLYILGRTGIISRGVKALDENLPTTVTAGARLRPGTYRWFLAITDLAGNTTTTPTKTVIADGRRLLPVSETTTRSVASLAATLRGGACSSATRAGGGIVLSSELTCASAGVDAETASASITLPLVAGATYGPVKLTTKSTGNNGVLTVFQGATQVVAAAGPVQAPSRANTVPGTVVTAAHTLRFAVDTGSGQRLILQSVSASYVVNQLR